MDILDAQRENRSVYIGGFVGQLVSSVIWLVSAALGTWVSPKASILAVVIAGFFIFALTQMLLRLSGRRARVSRENPLHWLGMQVAFVLPFSMLLLVPVGYYRLNWFFPALMILLGAHYLPFATLYGMRMFLFLAGILIAIRPHSPTLADAWQARNGTHWSHTAAIGKGFAPEAPASGRSRARLD